MSNRPFAPTRLVVALIAAGIVGVTGVTYASMRHANASTAAVITANAAGAETVSPSVPLGIVVAPDFALIAKRHGPAVVNISVSGVRRASNDDADDAAASPRGLPRLDPNDPMYEFFKRFQAPNGAAPGQRDMPVRGQGSGFIVSADGLILTNAHVVRDAKEVIVKLTDRREFQAKVLGSDPRTDVAVLRIDAKNLPVLPMGRVQDLQVGEWVLAIGSPFGFENSVTAGVVSAKGRSLPDDSFVPFIQTDVAVNPGNSGGPLFNARGEVIGINSQIFSRTGGYQGLSFAIPIDIARKVMGQIVATGKASHARLGVAIQDVNQALADSFKLDKPEGALVSNVDPRGPAAKAGLKSGDVILGVDGQPIVGSGDLPAVIGQFTPGSQVKIDVWRQGQRENMEVTLGDADEKAVDLAKGGEGDGAAAQNGKLGLALRPLQPQEQRQSGLDAGMVVEDVTGPAAKAGVQAGDLLLAINGTPVKDINQVRSTVAKAGKSVALLIQRDGQRIFVPVRLG